MKMLPTAHSYENTFNTRFFWGARQKLQKALTSEYLWIFVFDGSISSRKSKQQVDRHEYSGIPISRTLGFPNLPISRTKSCCHWICFTHVPYRNFTPDFSNPLFLERPDNSNQFWLPWDKLTSDNSNLRKSKPLRADVNCIRAFKMALCTVFERFKYHMCINIVFRWQMLANHIALGWRSTITSYSVRLRIEDSLRTWMLFLWQLLIEICLACFVNLPDL